MLLYLCNGNDIDRNIDIKIAKKTDFEVLALLGRVTYSESHGQYIDDKNDFLNVIGEAFYNESELNDKHLAYWRDWFGLYVARLQKETVTNEERITLMNSVNPKYVLRNYMAQLAIDKADNGDLLPFIQFVCSELIKTQEEVINDFKNFYIS